jgi:hypothetical protein
MVVVYIWAVELDVQDFAPQDEEVIVWVVDSATPGTVVVEGEAVDLSWLEWITRSAYVIKLFQFEPFIQPNIYLAFGLQHDNASSFARIPNSSVYRWVLEAEPMRPIYESSPTSGAAFCAARDISSNRHLAKEEYREKNSEESGVSQHSRRPASLPNHTKSLGTQT